MSDMNNLSVNPVKSSPAIGAAYCVQGIKKAMAFFHAPPGCTFLSKVLLTQHFMEPVGIAGSDTKEIATIFGSSEEIKVKIKSIVEKQSPDLIYIITSTTAEIRGVDIQLTLKELSTEIPNIPVIAVYAPDFSGSFSDGFSRVVSETLDYFHSHPDTIQRKLDESNHKQITVLPAPFMSATDISELEDIILSFGLSVKFLPDLSRSMDGSRASHSSMAHDGTTIEDIKSIRFSDAVITFSDSMNSAGKKLAENLQCPHYHISHIYGIKATDKLFQYLIEITKSQEVINKWKLQRARLQDLMVDVHLRVSQKKAAIALDYDQVASFYSFLSEMGMDTRMALSSVAGPSTDIKTGTLFDIEKSLETGNHYDLLITNSHGKEICHQYNIPHLRAGFPIYDRYGALLETRVGYNGGINMIKEITNLIVNKEETEIKYESSVCV